MGHWVRECPKLNKQETLPSALLSVRNESKSTDSISNSNSVQRSENRMYTDSVSEPNNLNFESHLLNNDLYDAITGDALVCDVSNVFTSTSKSDEDFFLADSGASMHMTFRRDFFSFIKPVPAGSSIKVADDKTLPAEGIGNIRIREIVDGNVFEHELTRVLFVPGLKRNLFSIGSINDKGFSFHSFKDRSEIRNKNGKIRLLGVRYGSLFRMLFDVLIQSECNLSESVMLWHKRMGHINVRLSGRCFSRS